MNLDMSSWKSFTFGELIDDIYKAEPHSKVLLNVRDRPRGDDVPFVTRDGIVQQRGLLCVFIGCRYGAGKCSGRWRHDINDKLSVGCLQHRRPHCSNQSELVKCLDRTVYRHLATERAVPLFLWQGVPYPGNKEVQLLLPAKKDGTPDWQWWNGT